MDSPSQKKTVFIIEDDLFLVQAYQIKFEKEGVEVWTATDGKSAMKFFEKEPPSVVLLDLLLPGISGLDILASIRADARWKSVPVFVLTNLGQQQDIDKVKTLGVEEYLVKANTKINDIVEKVKKYLSS